MKLFSLTNASAVLATVATVVAANDANEIAHCTGECARGLRNYLEKNKDSNGQYNSDKVKTITIENLGRSSDSPTVAYQITTGSGERFFEKLNPPPAGDNQSVNPRFGVVTSFSVINNYGCWCFRGSNWPGAPDKTGFGQAVDVYDDACKAHHMGFDCITLDANAEGESCIPNEQDYDLTIKPQPNGDFTLECADSMWDHWCKRRTCLVDLRLMARVRKLKDDGIRPDFEKYGHAGYHNDVGDFDKSVCTVPRDNNPNNGSGNHRREIKRVCCGDYPYRIWYDENNNRGISCCAFNDAAVINDYGFSLKVGQLYNKMSATCCDDKVISGSNIC